MLNARATVTIIAILLSVEPNVAVSSTVRDLVKSCGSSIDSADYSYCLGVMAGAEDLAAFAIGDDLVRNPLGTPDLNICLGAPDHAPGELADVFMAWAKAYPAAWNWDEAYGLVAAFRAKWPCGSLNH